MTLVSGSNNFSLAKSQTYYDFSAKVIVAPMWTKLLAIDDMGDLVSEKNWRSISIKMRRGY